MATVEWARGRAKDDDLTQLEEYTEHSLIEALQRRFERNAIYTNVSDVLIAVNPFKNVNIYTSFVADHYVDAMEKHDLPPHIFAAADQCFRLLRQTGQNQCCVISGESGAGKTETSKLFLRHLLRLSGSSEAGLDERVNEMNPVLEAFGNASTQLNHNSSRFGKYLTLSFDHHGAVQRAKIDQYLLEKSRVVRHQPGEANFHVFYMLMSCGDDALKASLYLSDDHQHRFLQAADNKARESVDVLLSRGLSKDDLSSRLSASRDNDAFAKLRRAFDHVGFKPDDFTSVVRLVAAILHLGDVDLMDDTCDGSTLHPETLMSAGRAAELLGITVDRLQGSITRTLTVTRGEEIWRKNSPLMAAFCRDAMAKDLYAKMFQWLIYHMNTQLCAQFGTPKVDYEISLLDIFGFECMPNNCFEQLLINMTNEQLQYFFNQNIFAWEQEEYDKQGIDLKLVEYADNRPVMDLFLHKSFGIIAMLNQESLLPRSSPESFSLKLHQAWSSSEQDDEDESLAKAKQMYLAPRDKGTSFTVVHFAGPVEYTTSKFLEKNRDPLPDDIVSALSDSTSDFVASLYKESFAPTPSAAAQTQSLLDLRPVEQRGRSSPYSRRRNRSFSAGKNQTAAAVFRDSLALLMNKMLKAKPTFIRCIKPNRLCHPNRFEQSYVGTQLRYTGVLETVRIRRDGFPIRVPFENILRDFGLLVFPMESLPTVAPNRANVEAVMSRTRLDGWLLGKDKVFMKAHHRDKLLDLRRKFHTDVEVVQRVIRGWRARKAFGTVMRMKLQQDKRIRSFLEEVETSCHQNKVQTLKTLGAMEEEFKRKEAEKVQLASQLAAMALARVRKKGSPASFRRDMLNPPSKDTASSHLSVPHSDAEEGYESAAESSCQSFDPEVLKKANASVEASVQAAELSQIEARALVEGTVVQDGSRLNPDRQQSPLIKAAKDAKDEYINIDMVKNGGIKPKAPKRPQRRREREASIDYEEEERREQMLQGADYLVVESGMKQSSGSATPKKPAPPIKQRPKLDPPPEAFDDNDGTKNGEGKRTWRDKEKAKAHKLAQAQKMAGTKFSEASEDSELKRTLRERDRAVLLEQAGSLAIRQRTAKSILPTASKARIALGDATCSDNMSFLQFLADYEEDPSSMVKCPVPGCQRHFATFTGLVRHSSKHAARVESDGGLTSAIFEDMSFLQSDMRATVLYFERSTPLLQLYVNSPQLAINGLKPEQLRNGQVSVRGVGNNDRDSRVAKIREHIGRGVLFTFDDDNNMLVRRLCKNPVYLRRSTKLVRKSADASEVGDNGELPLDKPVCLHNHRLFLSEMRDMDIRTALEEATVRLAFVRSDPEDDDNTPVWIQLRMIAAIQRWEAAFGPDTLQGGIA